MEEYVLRIKIKKVNGLWCLTGFYSAKIIGYIYIVRRKFLWWKLKPYLGVRVHTPYMENPYFDGERATNRILSSLEIEMRSELKIEKDKIQRRLDRLLKRK